MLKDITIIGLNKKDLTKEEVKNLEKDLKDFISNNYNKGDIFYLESGYSTSLLINLKAIRKNVFQAISV